MPLDAKPPISRSGLDASVAALRLRETAETPEEKAAAEAAVGACRRKVEAVLIAYNGSIEESARQLNASARTLYRVIGERNLDLGTMARRLQTRRNDE